MNKKILLYCCIAILLYCFSRPVFAQRQLDDYLFQYEKYRDIYEEFTLARDKYLKYQALSVKDEAVKALKKLLLQRNQVLRTHFLALEYKLRNTAGVIENQSGNGLISQLDKKVIWLEEQSEEIENLETSSLEDLFILSDRIEDKEAELKNLAYQSLGEILLGRIRALQAESVSITTLLKEEISQQQSATQAAQLNLWLREVGVKNYLSQQEIEAAEINLWKLREERRIKGMVQHFSNLQIDVDDARLYLKQAVSFQQEIYGELNYD